MSNAGMVSRWAVQARRLLLKHPRGAAVVYQYNECAMLLERLRSGGRRRTYSALRGELRERRELCAKRISQL